jgi:hypothetical protein
MHIFLSDQFFEKEIKKFAVPTKYTIRNPVFSIAQQIPI